jgi:hypothetical protein
VLAAQQNGQPEGVGKGDVVASGELREKLLLGKDDRKDGQGSEDDGFELVNASNSSTA